MSLKIKYPLIVGLSCLGTFTSCLVGPDYKKPEANTSQDWSTSEKAARVSNASQPIETRWWQTFQDPTLTTLIETSVQHNLDVKIASANIRQARALRQVQVGNFYPQVDAHAEGRREGHSYNGLLPVGPQQTAVPGVTSEGIPPIDNYYDVGFDARWELDLFGGTRRGLEAANAQIEVTLEQRNEILLSVFAEVARNYTELRGSQHQINIAQQNIDLQQQIVDIVRQRHQAGYATSFELARAQAQLQVTQASLPNLTADMRASAYRLAVLTGQEPQALLKDLLAEKPLSTAPDVVPLGLRSDILRRRPDVRSAERQLAAETANIGVATSDLFPKFFMTGSAGFESLGFNDLLRNTSKSWSLGGLVQWPVFRGGEIRARVKAQEAKTDAAAFNYEKVVLTALEDAETSLVRYGQELETRKKLQIAAASNIYALTLATQLYQEGEVDVLTVVDAARELNTVQGNLALSDTRCLVYLVSLYKALGGGWEVSEELETKNQTPTKPAQTP